MPLYANVFDGCERTEVHYRVNGGAYQPMTQVFEPDPWMYLYQEYSNRSQAINGTRSVNPPIPTPHLWKANLPNDLPVGVHSITVRAVNPRGEWQSSQVFEVVD